MIHDESVEKGLVGVLDTAQVDVAIEVGGLLLIGLVCAFDLLIQGFDFRGEQAVESVLGAFGLGEGGPLVEQGVVDEVSTAFREIHLGVSS